MPILNSISHLQGCTIYVSLFPCHECVKAIIQSGIKEIIYEDDKYNGTDSDRAAKTYVRCRRCQIHKNSSILNLNSFIKLKRSSLEDLKLHL